MEKTFGVEELFVHEDGAVCTPSGGVRTHKGESLLDLVGDYVVIDFETTGLNPASDHIIEIGAVKVSDGVLTEKYNTLVNPGHRISGFITDLTGITNEMVSGAPEIGDALAPFLSFLGNSVIVGHNVNFDINFLYDNCLEVLSQPFKNDFVDTMRISRRAFPDIRCHKLGYLAKLLALDGSAEHRALEDCLCTYKLYEYLKQYVCENQLELCARKRKKEVCAREIKRPEITLDKEHPLYQKECVFTGELEKLSRLEAMQIVADVGGINHNIVTKKTRFLILGNNDGCSNIKDGKSGKQKKAEKYISQGQELTILSEQAFYTLLENNGKLHLF